LRKPALNRIVVPLRHWGSSSVEEQLKQHSRRFYIINFYFHNVIQSI